MLVHIVVTALMAPIHLPPLVDIGFWRDTLALYLGYVIVISAFSSRDAIIQERGQALGRVPHFFAALE